MLKIAGVASIEDHTVMRIIFLNAARALIEGVQTTSVLNGLVPRHLSSMEILRKKQPIKKRPNQQKNRNGSEAISRMANLILGKSKQAISKKDFGLISLLAAKLKSPEYLSMPMV